LKRKLSFCILAAIPAALLPLAVAGQVAPSSGTSPAEKPEPVYNYQVFAGYAYSSLNQVNQSRSGLQGVELSVMRDWGKHFGLFGDGAFYKYAIKTGNPGSPSVDLVLFGPEFHAELYGRISGFVRASLGGEHTAGESEIPNVSFAGGFGGGMEYRFGPRLSLRASGDDILSSFVQDPEHLGYSPHKRGNGRAAFGVVYRF
jgi:outer membrane receptor protein involved in Fe transport